MVKKMILMYFLLGFALLSSAQVPRLMLPVGHTRKIQKVSFSNGDNGVISIGEDKTLKIWDVMRETLLVDIAGVQDVEKTTDVCPTANLVLAAMLDTTLKIWNTKTGVLVRSIGHPELISYARFSADGKKVMIFSSYRRWRVWDLHSGKLLLEHIEEGLAGGGFSPDGQKIVIVASDGIKVIGLEKGTVLLDIKIPRIYSIKFFPNSDKMISTSFDGEVKMGSPMPMTSKIWDGNSGRLLLTLMAKTEGVNLPVISPDGKKVILPNGKAAKILDAITGKPIYSLGGHSLNISSASFSADSKKVLTSSWDHTAIIWDLETGKGTRLLGHSSLVHFGSFSRNGLRVVTSSSDMTIRVWEVATGKQTQVLSGVVSRVAKVVCFPNSKKMLTVSDKFGQIWDMENGKISQRLNGHWSSIYDADVSSDGKALLTGSADGTAKIWDAENGSLLHTLRGHTASVDMCRFSPDGGFVVTSGSDSTVRLWDRRTGMFRYVFNQHHSRVIGTALSADGGKLAICALDRVLRIWDTTTGRPLANAVDAKVTLYHPQFSPDGSMVLANSLDRIYVFDANSGAKIREINCDYLNMARFSPDGKWIICFSFRNIKVYHAETAELDYTLGTGFESQYTVGFSPDGKSFLTRDVGGLTHQVELQTGKDMLVFRDGGDPLSEMKFTTDGKRIITSGFTTKLWDIGSGKNVGEFVAVGQGDYFVQIPEGYYQASKNAARRLYYVSKELKTINFEQLDVKYNRPDKVLENLGSTDAALVRSYRAAYEKRVKRMGIDTAGFGGGISVPQADIANRGTISFDQHLQQLTLHIKGSDEHYNLDRFNIWVNKNPIFGAKGLNLLERKSRLIDTSIVVLLSDGKNRIETSVTNVNGTESYRMPVQVRYVPLKKQVQKLYFIGIGLDRFQNDSYNLNWSVKDIRDLVVALKPAYGATMVVDTLFNERVTIEAVKALKEKLKKSGINDKVIIAYSGHGLLNGSLDYYLSTFAVDFEHPERGGLPYEAIENLLDGIPSRNKLMLIDACHSGEVDKEELERISGAQESLATNNIQGGKGVKIRNVAERKSGMRTSLELMQQLFSNVEMSTGSTIISAAAGTQFALEKNNLKNGVFTYCILEYIKFNRHITVTALRDYVCKRVEELTAGLQVPTTRSENDAIDWEIL